MNQPGSLFAAQLVATLLYLFAPPLQAQPQDEAKRPSRKLDVWYVPTTTEVVDRMLDLAKVKPLDVVYDLGCGDGRIVIAASKNYGARAIGVDLDPARIREANANARKAGVEKFVTFKVQDLFKTDLREATVVTLYLLPELNKRLIPKLFAELKPGARVVSHDWDMGKSWPADQYVKLGGDGIYLWIMPGYEERKKFLPAQPVRK